MHIIIVLIFFTVYMASAQSVSIRMGARSAGMGNSGFALTDESSLFQNVASLGSLSHPSAFFSYELVPALPGAARTAAALTCPTSFGVFSAGTFRFGDDLYSEQLLTAGFANRIGHTSLGARVSLLQYRADGFGTRTAFTVDVGGLTQLTPEWSVGAGIFNVNQASLTDDESLPVIFVAALQWHEKDGPLISIETEKTLHAPLRMRGGIEFGIRKKMFLRMGSSSPPFALSAGTGIQTARLRMDFAVIYNMVFDFLYQASASYRLGKKKGP